MKRGGAIRESVSDNNKKRIKKYKGRYEKPLEQKIH